MFEAAYSNTPFNPTDEEATDSKQFDGEQENKIKARRSISSTASYQAKEV